MRGEASLTRLDTFTAQHSLELGYEPLRRTDLPHCSRLKVLLLRPLFYRGLRKMSISRG